MASVIPVLAALLGVGALIAFRGCPMCWLTGLVQTLEQPAPNNHSGEQL